MKTILGISCILLILLLTGCSSEEKWNKIREKESTQKFLREMAKTEKTNGVVKILIGDYGDLYVAAFVDEERAERLAKTYCKKAVRAGIEVEGCFIFAARGYRWWKWGMKGTLLATYKNND